MLASEDVGTAQMSLIRTKGHQTGTNQAEIDADGAATLDQQPVPAIARLNSCRRPDRTFLNSDAMRVRLDYFWSYGPSW